MKRVMWNKKGFTLIEIVVVLLLVGLVTAVVGLSVVKMVNNFFFARTNADTLLKGQIAMARMVKELNNVRIVSAASATSITFTSYRDANTRTISWGGSGTNLLLNGDTLTDDVDDFSLAYYDTFDGAAQTTWAATRRMIEITLSVKGAENTISTFNARVAPSFDVLPPPEGT